MTKPADWKTYDEFADGIATNRLPSSPALDGRCLSLILGERRVTLAFHSTSHDWQEDGLCGTDWCEVIEVAPEVYFVDRLRADQPDKAETLILDLNNGHVLSILSHVRPPDAAPGEPQVAQVFQPGQIDGVPQIGPVPAPTRDLIGVRAHFTYSPNHVYEHTYLSSLRYAWQNLVGVQRGHGDVDMASTWKFAENMYVFTFREFKIPVASTFFYNFDSMRSTGKFLGLDAHGHILNAPAGAFIRLASVTQYQPGQEPI